MELSATETRVLGCLLEKQRTTPDAYPLSLNALRLACNQTTNRDPVVEYDEALIRDAIHRLERRGLARLASGAGSRATKYRHLLAEALPMNSAEQAVMCVLMLRGPQTPGELKQRGERMHAFPDLGAVHETLDHLIERELVVRLERRPGHKEERYAQLLQAREEEPVHAAGPASPVPSPEGERSATLVGASAAGEGHMREPHAGGRDEVGELAERVARLEREVAELRAAMRHPVGS
ncbi:MAG TPA: YceH family protein, partial [Solirubrobacteraceae bacterium]|nr:YceH family protein [Solirubrobacteraceae bacterium]